MYTGEWGNGDLPVCASGMSLEYRDELRDSRRNTRSAPTPNRKTSSPLPLSNSGAEIWTSGLKAATRFRNNKVTIRGVAEPAQTASHRDSMTALSGRSHSPARLTWPHGRHFAAGSATIPAASWPHPPAIFAPPAARRSERPTAAEARVSRPATLGSFRIEGGGH